MRAPRTQRLPEGIRCRHSRSCPVHRDHAARCRCEPTYEASVWSRRDNKKLRQTFATVREAKAWRDATATDVRNGKRRAPTSVTVREAGDALIAGIKAGTIRDRSGKQYKPSTVRGYERALRDRVYPDLGAARLAAIERVDVQDLADRLAADTWTARP